MTDAHPAFPGIAWADLAAELAREREARDRLYPDLVAKLRMTAEQAAHGLAIIAAIAADLPRMQGDWREGAPGHAFTWAERRNALLREAALRARHYPAWIAEGRFAQAEGDRRRACLELLLLRIYEDGFDWRPSNGLPPPYHGRPGDDYRQALAELHAMLFDAFLRQRDRAMAAGTLRCLRHDGHPDLAAALEARIDPPQQQELAL
jgi:hypothetical protein